MVCSLLALAFSSSWADSVAGSGQGTLPPDTDFAVVERGANHRIWEKTTYEVGPNGLAIPQKHRYTELATGLNYWQNGQWVESQEVIEPYSTGAIARQGQHQVIFANNINSAGAIDEQTPDGKRLRSNIIGLIYYDKGTGNAVLIAQLKDSQGQLVSANQVLYQNAFQGVNADVQYSYTRSGFEQDVILRDQLPTPESYGLDPDTTELEVCTEFLSPPDASVTGTETVETGLDPDENIDWGATRLGQGKAFSLGTQKFAARVAKRYTTIEGRHFLLEKVLIRDIQPALSNLPHQSSNTRRLPYLASKMPYLPKAPQLRTAARPIRLALADRPQQGYVLDYVTLNATYTNYTFQGDTTYYVTGPLNLYGTTVLEGGAVIKASLATNYVALNINGPVVCNSGPYRPVVFTAKDDNTVGDSVSGSTGSPSGYYGRAALYFNQSVSGSAFDLHDVRISYFWNGVIKYANPTALIGQVRNSQLCNIGTAALYGNSGDAGAFNVENVLVWKAGVAFSNSTFYVQNATLDKIGTLGGTNDSIAITNSLLVSVTNWGVGFTSVHNATNSSSSTVFQTVGAASHYLTNSSYRGIGTANVDPNMLTSFQQKTTWPPKVYSSLTLSVVTNYSAIVQRDTNSAPDLGYHYDVLDYVFGGVTSYSNITFNAGVAVGWYEPSANYGISFYDNAVAAFNGTATVPCVVARYSSVQEGGNSSWTSKGSTGGIIAQSLSGGYSMSPTNAAQAKAQFTRFYMVAGGPNHFRELSALLKVTLNNCEMNGSSMAGYWDYFYLTNSLFDRCSVGVVGGNAALMSMRNCTVHGGNLYVEYPGSSWPLWIQNCAFDNVNLSDVHTNTTTYCDYCAIVTNLTTLPVPGGHDVIVTNFNWQTNWLGNYYLPSGSPLVDKGNTNADLLGLYYFTTQTNQVPETNSIVDIGYHYYSKTALYATIASQPTDIIAPIGGGANFSESVGGAGPFTYQWLFNGAPVQLNDIITTFAGNHSGAYSGDFGVATNASLNNPFSGIFDNIGNFYIADSSNNVIRKVDTNGIITTVAGSYGLGANYSGDGSLATNAALNTPSGVVVDQSGNLYIADTGNSVIRKVDTNGVITTFAGNAAFIGGYSGDGSAATSAGMNHPNGIALDAWGNLFISDTGNSVIRKVDTNGIITTIAGNYVNGPGYSGDGSTATNASLNYPVGMAVDWLGNLYIADATNNVIRKVGTNGIITTLAGNAAHTFNFAGDGGAATNAFLTSPWGVTFDNSGNLYIADSGNSVIRKVDTNGIIHTVAGNHALGGGYSGDGGVATNAGLNFPTGVGLNSVGNLYVADLGNNVIRQVVFSKYDATISNGVFSILIANTNNIGNYQVAVSNAYNSVTSSIATLTLFLPPTNQSVWIGDDAVFSVTALGTPNPSFQWYFNSTNLLAGATNSSLTVNDVQSNNVGNYCVVLSNVGGSVTSSPAALAISGLPSYVVPYGTLTNYTFQSDRTYYIGTIVSLAGSSIIEGGSVIKFSTNGSLLLTGPLTCKTGPYHPALLTSRNDNSAGLAFHQSTGLPQTATNGFPYLNYEGWSFTTNTSGGYADATIKYLRCAFADQGVAATEIFGSGMHPAGVYTGSLHVWDCQFVGCKWGLANWFEDSLTFDLHNDLFTGCLYSVAGPGSGTGGATILAEQVTSDTAGFWDTNNPPAAVCLTNSILLGNVPFSGIATVITNSVLVNPTGILFTNAGGAGYYLAPATYQSAGTSLITPAMRAELAHKTTGAPNGTNLDETGTYELAPQVVRDSSRFPDLGYHYDPLDFIIGSAPVYNAWVWVDPGTAIGTFGTNNINYGLDISFESQFVLYGLADNPIDISSYNTVQETVVPGWNTISNASVICDAGNESNIFCYFVNWSGFAQDTIHLDGIGDVGPVTVRNCQFFGGRIISSVETMNFTNCLFERLNCDIEPNDSNTPVLCNNLFYYGTFSFYPHQTNSVMINNLFDHTLIPDHLGAVGNTYLGGYNAYVTNCNRLNPTRASDIILSNSLVYQAGPLGNYYQPAGSPLINQGSTTADQIGYYHFTVITNLLNGLEIKETNSVVDIGFHYIATDTNGSPIDMDGDGIADYIEDSNGNGLYDAGDWSDWTDYYNGNKPVLYKSLGDAQVAPLGTFFPQPLVALATDNHGNPLKNAPITFNVTNGMAQIALTNGGVLVTNVLLRTDSAGYAGIYLYLPTNAPATNIVTVTGQSETNATTVTFTCYEGSVATPSFSPYGGPSTVFRSVTLNSTTPGAVIHYTINGNDPTENDPGVTNGQCVVVPWTTMLKAEAFEDSILLPSAIQATNYTLIHPLVAGGRHTLILQPNETILAAGFNGSGQLGNGTNIDSTNLVVVSVLTNAVGIAAGGAHSLAWDAYGNAWAWGDDSYGQLGDGIGSGLQTNAVHILQTYFIVQMAAGAKHSLALDRDGFVYACGANDSGQLGNGTTSWSSLFSPVGGVTNIVELAAGGAHSLALVTNGTVQAWGNNDYGQLGDGTTSGRTSAIQIGSLTNVFAIAAGYGHNLAVMSNETIQAWGENNYGQLGDGTTNNRANPVLTIGLSNVVAIASGQYHNLALESNGTVWAWGYNSRGQLGDGTTNNRAIPVPVSGLSNVVAIAAGLAHSAALKSDGTLLIWGSGGYGLYGDTGTNYSTTPVSPVPPVNVHWDTPIIVSEPFSQSAQKGDTVTFKVVATGTNLTYQWFFLGTAIPGATSNTYTIDSIQDSDFGNYSVTVGNGLNSVSSTNVRLDPVYGSSYSDLVLLDGTRWDYTFKKGITYYIGRPIKLLGNTTIEGGAVLKFDNDFSTNASLQVLGGLNCNSKPYDPAIFTSIDDDTIGRRIGSSDWYPQPPAYGNATPYLGMPSYGVPYLDLSSATSNKISNLRFYFAGWAVTVPTNSAILDVWDCVFVNCNQGVVDLVPGGSTNSFHNVLFGGCGTAVQAATNVIAIQGEQITANVSYFCQALSTPNWIGLTNSLIWGYPLTASAVNTVNVAMNPDPTNFVSVGEGNYYLAPTTPFHGSGTASITPRLQTELQHKTTSAPISISSGLAMSGQMMLSPQAQRYTNGAPDLGYYYDAMDYTVSALCVNGSLTVLPDTVVGTRTDVDYYYGAYYVKGIYVYGGGSVMSHGMPLKPIIYVAADMVQETPNIGFSWYDDGVYFSYGVWIPAVDLFSSDYQTNDGVATTLDFRFSDFYVPAGDLHYCSGMTKEGLMYTEDGRVNLNMQDCQFHGGVFNIGQPYVPGTTYDTVYGSGSVSLNNNLFDGVVVNVDPTYNENSDDDLGLNVDLAFEANNNLFRGGALRLEPIPASAGNWVFENNLFDKVVFSQDTNQPLNFDYNGYWPLSARESASDLHDFPSDDTQLRTTTTGTSFTDGGHEQVVTATPPYQTGPLGDYYLPTNTPLYGAGSDTTTNLGLYHYTTRLDQLKEGNDISSFKPKASIGLHYIAVTNGVPIDTDGDGIPDYVENWHGDGCFTTHAGLETDWQNQITDGVSPDPSNSLYLDVDLSGDGLVGRIKTALGFNPLSTSNPLWLNQKKIGNEPEVVAFNLPLNYNSLTNVGGLDLFVDGEVATLQELVEETNGQCQLLWNTTYDSPGPHLISTSLHLRVRLKSHEN